MTWTPVPLHRRRCSHGIRMTDHCAKCAEEVTKIIDAAKERVG